MSFSTNVPDFFDLLGVEQFGIRSNEGALCENKHRLLWCSTFNGMSGDDTVFAYQLMTGLGIAIKKNLILDLSYRFQSASGDANISGADVQYMSSNFNVGIRYNF